VNNSSNRSLAIIGTATGGRAELAAVPRELSALTHGSPELGADALNGPVVSSIGFGMARRTEDAKISGLLGAQRSVVDVMDMQRSVGTVEAAFLAVIIGT
jgi:hypothetical protein